MASKLALSPQGAKEKAGVESNKVRDEAVVKACNLVNNYIVASFVKGTTRTVMNSAHAVFKESGMDVLAAVIKEFGQAGWAVTVTRGEVTFSPKKPIHL